jgi:hypothetical protein
MPIQILSGTILCLISQFMRTIMSLPPTLRCICPWWSSLFVGIMAVRMLPGYSTTSKNRIYFLGYLLWHYSPLNSSLSHQHCWWISNRSSMSKSICGMIILPIVNIMVPGHNVPEVETPFIVSSPPKYTTHSPFGRATWPMVAFNMETRQLVFLKEYWRVDVGGMEKED